MITMKKISKEEISTYTDIQSRIEEWLVVLINKMRERNLLSSIRFCYLDRFDILSENLYLTYAYNQYNETEQETITIPLHVIYEDKMDWFIDKLEKEKEQEKLEQEKEKFELEKKEAMETIKKLIDKYNISILY